MTNIMYELIFTDSLNQKFIFHFAHKHQMMRHFKLFRKNFFSSLLSKFDNELFVCAYDSSGKIF